MNGRGGEEELIGGKARQNSNGGTQMRGSQWSQALRDGGWLNWSLLGIYLEDKLVFMRTVFVEEEILFLLLTYPTKESTLGWLNNWCLAWLGESINNWWLAWLGTL